MASFWVRSWFLKTIASEQNNNERPSHKTIVHWALGKAAGQQGRAGQRLQEEHSSDHQDRGNPADVYGD